MTFARHDWLSLEGASVTGRAPPQLLVRAPDGIALSAEQYGSIAHAYKLFCDVVRGSTFPEGLHVQNRTLADGSKLRMTSNLGVHTVTVTISGGAVVELYCGFVIKPKTINGATYSATDITGLLRRRSTSWDVWVKPYSPGRTGATPTYFVDSIRSGRAGPPKILSDTSYYADVISFSNGRVFKNGQPKGAIPAGGSAFPVLLPGRVLFAIDDTTAGRISSSTTLDNLFTWAPTVASGATRFDAGVRYTHEDDLAEYLTLGLTVAGALQVRRAALTLLNIPPWASSTGELMSQVDVPGAVVSSGGYTSTDVVTPTSPVYGLQDESARVCGWQYAHTVQTFAGLFIGGDLVTDDEETHYHYERTLDGSAPNINLFGGIAASMSRQVVINSLLTVGNIFWSNTWNGSPVWTAGSSPDVSEYLGYSYYQSPPAGLDTSGINSGDPIIFATQEIGGILDEQDTSAVETSLSTGQVIFSSTTVHSTDHSEITAVERTPDTPPSSYSVGNKFYSDPGPGPDLNTNWNAFVYPTQSFLPDLARENRLETIEVDGVARDYIYFDGENDVYVWLESTLAGLKTYTYTLAGGSISNSTTGFFNLSIVLKASSGATTFTGTSRAFNHATPATANLVSPSGIDQSNINRVWRHVAPLLAYPIFAPRWMEQGACPHIAYTTAAENAVAAAHTPPQLARLLASFRLQISLLSRPPLTDLTPIADAAIVCAPMMEQLLTHHWTGLAYSAFADIEAEPFILNASYPGAAVHTDVGITGSNPHSEFYRA